MITIDRALELFENVASERQQQRERALDGELSWVKLIQLQRPLEELFDGGKARDFVDLVDRPRKPEPEWFEQARAEPLAPLELQAVSRATLGGETIALVFTRSPATGMDLYQRFTVAEVGTGWRQSEPKIVSYYVRCGECSTKLSLAGGEGPATLPGCGDCKWSGWRFAHAGHEHAKPAIEETRRLAEPADPLAKRLWLAL